MTSKERATLRSMGTKVESIYQIGKENLSENQINGITEALEKRELIKITTLKSADKSASEIAVELAHKLRAEVVAVTGSKILLYKRSNNKDVKHIEF